VLLDFLRVEFILPEGGEFPRLGKASSPGQEHFPGRENLPPRGRNFSPVKKVDIFNTV